MAGFAVSGAVIVRVIMIMTVIMTAARAVHVVMIVRIDKRRIHFCFKRH